MLCGSFMCFYHNELQVSILIVKGLYMGSSLNSGPV